MISVKLIHGLQQVQPLSKSPSSYNLGRETNCTFYSSDCNYHKYKYVICISNPCLNKLAIGISDSFNVSNNLINNFNKIKCVTEFGVLYPCLELQHGIMEQLVYLMSRLLSTCLLRSSWTIVRQSPCHLKKLDFEYDSVYHLKMPLRTTTENMKNV